MSDLYARTLDRASHRARIGSLIVLAAFLSVPAAGLSFPPAAMAGGVQTCHGKAATVVGVTGTAGDDVIVGTSGSDTIQGFAGNDTICGREGFDIIAGGPGNDLLDGETSSDAVDFAAAGTSVRVDLGREDPQVTGEGTDTLVSFSEAHGSSQADTLLGSGTNGGAPELLYGGDGNDTLNGRGGIDTVSGGPGVDTLIGGRDSDVLLGGIGLDTASYKERGAGVTVTLDGIANDGNGADGSGTRDNVGLDVENVTGGEASDNLAGNGAANKLIGGPGGDRLDGAGGADTLLGGGGPDSLLARDGVKDKRLDCGPQADTLRADAIDPAGVDCETLAP